MSVSKLLVSLYMPGKGGQTDAFEMGMSGSARPCLPTYFSSFALLTSPKLALPFPFTTPPLPGGRIPPFPGFANFVPLVLAGR